MNRSTMIEATTSLGSMPVRDVLYARIASEPTVVGRNRPQIAEAQ
jgi:hypothetical protein